VSDETRESRSSSAPSSAATSAPALEFRGVHAGYPELLGLRTRPVLVGIDLVLARGTVLGLAGPNGSGKSTLLRLAAGIEEPTAGRVFVFGESPQRASARARVGYLPEDSPFPGELGARAALELSGMLQGLSKKQLAREIERLLALVGLAREARTRLARFSRGMLRRFGLAQAWLHAPELLLLDEPTAGLDAQGFGVLAELLGEARTRRASVVLASHAPSDLVEHANELAVIQNGRIGLAGDPRIVLAGKTLLELYAP
jgi:ABC-2 type transport system ATP-binding protein